MKMICDVPDEVIKSIKGMPSVTPQYIDAEIQKMQELEQAEIQKAYELGKAEMQPCEDAISRQAALEAIRKCHCEEWVKADIGAPIEALQSVTPAEKVGHWIPVSERLPEKLQDVLVTFYDAEGEYDVAYRRKTFNESYKAQGSEDEWVSSMGETTYADYEISAWMPIKPYKASPTGAESEG